MIEHDDEFEGVGAHVLNPRFDWIPEEHGEQPVMPGLPNLRRLAQIRSFMDPSVPLEGHDGSHYQYDAGPVDLPLLASVTWIFWWKATQSTSYTDPTFLKTWARRQLFKVRHPYHWLSSTTDPEKQADHFVQIVGEMRPGDNGMLDAEEGGITVEKCLGWLEYVEARKKRPQSVYSGLYVAGGTIWNDDRIREGKYGMRPMHLAAYISEIRLKALMQARNAKPFHGWQYSSDGPVPGITGRADMNGRINRAVYEKAAGLEPIPEEEEEEMDYFARNNEPRDFEGAQYPAGAIKYERVRMHDGSTRLRRLSPGELRLMGHPNVGVEFGEPMSNAEIDEIGEWTPQEAGEPGAPVVFPRYTINAIAEPE